MGPDLLAVVARLRSAWDEQVRPSTRRALVALVVAGVFGAAHVARTGAPAARLGAALALAGLALGLVVRVVVARTRRADVRHTLRSTVGKTDPALSSATLRALRLVETAAVDAHVGSPVLASLHLSRLLGRASLERVAERASAAARRWSTAGLALGVLALVFAVREPFRIVEGLDVLVARQGEAPLPLAWLDEVEIVAKPPEYLHQDERPVFPFAQTAQPRGTTLTVRGRPLHDGRNLVLTDGKTEVSFVDDGGTGVVARWIVQESGAVFVAARFGAVRVREPDGQPVTSIPDEAPKVKVEGAPRTVRILDEPSIPIRYEVVDDHGLREVDLVLRAGGREERRVLSKPAADAKEDRGGYELRAVDPFFKRTFAPIEVRVEARDNDPYSGSKWGRSEAIIVVPPQVGEPEALRFAALTKARDALIDLVADRLTDKGPKPGASAAHLTHEKEAQLAADAAAQAALTGTYGGLSFSGRIVRVARGQLRRLSTALDAERKTPTAAQHQKLLAETEQVLLAFDSGLRILGFNDTRAVARKLATVADDAADAAATGASALAVVNPEARAAAAAPSASPPSWAQRLDAAVGILDGGGAQLLKLGDLGLDIGEIVQNDLRRVARARKDGDLLHAELAARDLAARLRKPNPSFGGGGRGGVESGGMPSPGAGDASSADQESMSLDDDLNHLAQEHEGEMNSVSESLERAMSAEDLQQLRDEAKQHAEAIREAVRGLPPPGGDPGSAEAAAGTGKEQAEAMAGALERGQPREAVGSGKDAMKSLNEAKRLGDQAGGFFPELRAGREAGRAAGTVERELEWAEQALEKLRRSASARAKDDLDRSSKKEQELAERARKLAEKGQSGDGAMPEEMLEHLSEAEREMRLAERQLGQGEGEDGLSHQREAQRHLDMAKGTEEDHESKGDEMDKKAEIPGKDQHKGPEDFRRRVLEGLGGSADPRLREAVRRYAEGLIR